MAPRPPRAAARRIWPLVALVVFLIVDIALVAFALNRANGIDALIPDPAVETTAAPAPSATETAALVAPSRTLTALDAAVAWRGDVGTCPASTAALELTTDAGATWVRHPLNPPTELRSILSVDVIDRSEVHVVGQSGDDCTMVLGRSYTAGLDWVESPDRLGSVWFVDPADPTLVRSPSSTRPVPCGTVVDVAAVDGSTAAALCADHTVQRTTDGGATWDSGLVVPGVVAIDAVLDDGYVLAAVGDEACDGVQLRSLPRAGPDEPSPQGCLPARTTHLAPGSVAVSAAGDAVWLWVDEAVRVSQDGGMTW